MCAREAPLGLVPMSVAWRLAFGVALGLSWTEGVVRPLVRVIESDLPRGVVAAMMFAAIVAPALLYLRRYAMPASVRWTEVDVTLLRGGRVATSIAWADAMFEERVDGDRWPARVLRVGDAAGRRITVVGGARLGVRGLDGRCSIRTTELDALLTTLRSSPACAGSVPIEDSTRTRDFGAVLAAIVLLQACVYAGLGGGAVLALPLAIVCALLLRDPLRRLRSAFTRPRAHETLLIDTEERGHLRARRLDGSRVLLDVSAASHPDAMLHSRRGFVGAVLDVPQSGGAASYRAPESPIPAIFVETRDDRVLRFEQLRAALVDVIGYGTFFATSITALLVSA